MSDEVCVLDKLGLIVQINDAWLNFAADNGLAEFAWLKINYLDFLDAVAGVGAVEARQTAFGLRKVLANKSKAFSSEFECSSPEEPRYFAMRASRHLDPKRDGLVIVITNITSRQLFENKYRSALTQIINVLCLAGEQRDPYTAGHQKRVAELSVAIGKKLDLSDNRLTGLSLSASVHDLGKLRVPAEILTKPSRLSGTEFALVKEHSTSGHEILQVATFEWPIADMVLQHHERMDGSGYPNGLKGDAILLEARIICVADVFESIAAHRPYRAARGFEVALQELIDNRGVWYDAEVVDACIKVIRDDSFKFTQTKGALN